MFLEKIYHNNLNLNSKCRLLLNEKTKPYLLQIVIVKTKFCKLFYFTLYLYCIYLFVI